MKFATIADKKIVLIKPYIDFFMDNDGYAVVFDRQGKKIGEKGLYGWNCEEPYISTPLYFFPLPAISEEQKFRLIRQFEEWYGCTDIMPSYWALEFELVVRMLCYDETAIIVNPKFLKLDDSMYQTLMEIIWPE